MNEDRISKLEREFLVFVKETSVEIAVIKTKMYIYSALGSAAVSIAAHLLLKKF